MRNRIFCITACIAVVLITTGCPANQQQAAANASLQASTIISTAQQGEIVAHNQGLIPDADHQFVQQEFENLGQVGKTVDACIGSASGKAGVFTCLNSAISSVDQMQQQGTLNLKSTNAKQTFSTVISGVRGVLATIEATLGGTPPVAPAS